MALRSVAALVAVGAGCGGTSIDLPDGQVWTSPHFRYAARADDPAVCDGVLDRLEAHFALLHAYLGIEWPGGTIDYYKFRDEADLDAHGQCALLADACRIGSTVQSPRVLHEHELIHIYTMQLGHPPAMFEEGLAEALSPEGRGFLEPQRTWQEVLGAPPRAGGVPASIAYWGGGWFVAYPAGFELADTHSRNFRRGAALRYFVSDVGRFDVPPREAGFLVEPSRSIRSWQIHGKG